MKNTTKTMAAALTSAILLFCFGLTGCMNGYEPVKGTVIAENQYGDVMLDLEAIDLEYGDSVNISFSGGYEMEMIPYYPDFYGNKDSAILTDHFDTICIAGIGCNFNGTAGIQIGEEVEISLEKKGRYRDEFEAYNINNAVIQFEGQSDEAFRNAREITAGQIQNNRLYRGASPFDQEYGRVELMARYIQDNDINCVLDLADTCEKLESYDDLPDHTASLIANDQVIVCAIGVDYTDPDAMQTFGRGLAQMSEMEGPYLIQCSLGRDRTGVICAVIEALCGATYQEIVDDYMTSYDTLHSIDMDPDSLQYRLFKQRIDEQLEAILGIDIEQLPDSELMTPAYDYLIQCGMTEQQIDNLIDQLC